jgi:hypothetical protein
MSWLSMTQDNLDNRRRMFADVVSIDAWHDEFTLRRKKADLHAHVVFGTARLGGEPESKVTFRLSLKRAEFVVIAPQTEPVRIDKASVSRDAPERHGKKTRTEETTIKTRARAIAQSKLSEKEASASLTGEIEADAGTIAKEKLETSEIIRLMLVTQSTDVDGNYRWTIEPEEAKILKGQPWDAQRDPRLQLVDERENRSRGLAPVVRIEVRCLREDMVIEEIRPKDPGVWEKVKAKSGFGNRLIAAQAYIRTRLLKEGLEVGDITDRFAGLTLASVLAEPIQK